MAIWDFEIIDGMSHPDRIRDHVAHMSQSQRTVHAWMTATLDVAYPITYGLLFAGLSLRVFRPIFVIPAIAVIPVDLTEGFAQVLILTGNDSLLWLKAYVTPLKRLFFVSAILIALLAVGLDVKNRKKRNN